MEEKLREIIQQPKVPTLLLHSCCGPCSTYVLEILSEYFQITIFYYNPNITEIEEYQRRAQEQQFLIQKLNTKHPISFLEGNYQPKDFYNAIQGLEKLGEGSERCFSCYRLRLEETAKTAKKLGLDYFTTTLSVSPHKNSQVLNEIGQKLENKYQTSYLYSDFKKKNGYQRSIELSENYNLYRQDYCGCIYSKLEKEQRKA